MRHTHSVAAGLDYIGVSPILSHLFETGRVRFEAADDKEVVGALRRLMRTEGIIAALESAHAVAGALREIPDMNRDSVVVINLSGRDDKDIFTIADAMNDREWNQFLKKRVAQL